MNKLRSNRSGLSIILLTIFGLSILAHGQQNIKKGDKVFSVVHWVDLGYKEIFYKVGKKLVPIEVKKLGRRSDLYPIKSKGTFELYAMEPNFDGEMEPKLIAKTSYDASISRMLFMLFPAKEDSSLPVSIRGINDSVEAFPPGSFRFANYTSKSLKVSFKGQKETLEPKEIKLYKFAVKKNGGLESMIVTDEDGEFIFGKRMFAQPAVRNMVFISMSEKKKGALTAKSLQDIIKR